MKNNLVTNSTMRSLLYKEAINRGAVTLPYSPFTIFLDPSNICDLRCTFCPQSNWGKRERGQMQWDLFEKVMEEIVLLRPEKLFLFCFGEATLHKRIIDMVRYATQSGLYVRIHTNAFNMTEEKARGLIEAGLNECVFSFDTADKALYNRMRQRSDFDRVIHNIRRMVNLRSELAMRTPLFRMHEILPDEYGMDKPVNSQAYKDLFTGLDLKFKAKYMHSFAGQGSEKSFTLIQERGKSFCTQLYRRIVVSFDGKIHACCLDPEGYNIVGDITKGDTIAATWNSPKMSQLRKLTNQDEVAHIQPCQNCEILKLPPKSQRNRFKRFISSLMWELIQMSRSKGGSC